jgi:hypothetical protein
MYTCYQKTTYYKTHTHTLQNKLKQPQNLTHTKWSGHNMFKYHQYKDFSPQELHRSSLHCTSLQNKLTSRKSCRFNSHQFASRHITYLHSFVTWIPFACNYILNPHSKSKGLQRKDASEPAANWFQLLMVLFTKECNALLEVAFKITCESRKLLRSEDIRLVLFSPTVTCCVLIYSSRRHKVT